MAKQRDDYKTIVTQIQRPDGSWYITANPHTGPGKYPKQRKRKFLDKKKVLEVLEKLCDKLAAGPESQNRAYCAMAQAIEAVGKL